MYNSSDFLVKKCLKGWLRQRKNWRTFGFLGPIYKSLRKRECVCEQLVGGKCEIEELA